MVIQSLFSLAVFIVCFQAIAFSSFACSHQGFCIHVMDGFPDWSIRDGLTGNHDLWTKATGQLSYESSTAKLPATFHVRCQSLALLNWSGIFFFQKQWRHHFFPWWPFFSLFLFECPWTSSPASLAEYQDHCQDYCSPLAQCGSV